MLTDLLTLLGWALAILATVLFFHYGSKLQDRIQDNQLRKVLTRRGMTIESMQTQRRFFDRYERLDRIEFEVIFTTPRGRRIQGIFRLCYRWKDLLRFRTFRFHGRSDRPAHSREKPKTSIENRKSPRTLFETTKEPKTTLERWFG